MKINRDEIKKRVVDSLRLNLEHTVGYWILCLEKVCESPIEVAFGAALLTADQLEHRNMNLGLVMCGPNEIADYREDLALMIPQFPWEGYRIDFALRLPSYRFKWLFIECDGHDFHERTKEQAARDRSKDRDVQQAGYPVLRFTGSEIHKNAAACGQQVIDFVAERYDDFIP